MTARITVHADHGWPVKVTSITRAAVGTVETETTVGVVESGKDQEFNLLDGHDLRVHEIQPGELPARLIPPPDE